MSEHLSDLDLDGLRLGVAGPAVDRAHLDGCLHCRQRSAALAASAEDFARRFEPAGLAADALARAERQPRRWMLWPPVLAGAAVAASLAVVGLQVNLRSKGAASLLEVYQLEGQERRAIQGPVPKDARLAVRMSAGERRRIRLLWSPAAGKFQALAPAEQEAPLELLGPTWLDREIALDGAPEPEALIAVACTAPFDHRRALELAAGEDDPDCQVERIEIEKR
ncbi:MAG: hypothetical protein IT384_00885 [Deltaproteobacteria bacterium]|nr:hypothetical protein [Deltaproteobacteria bacterium]